MGRVQNIKSTARLDAFRTQSIDKIFVPQLIMRLGGRSSLYLLISIRKTWPRPGPVTWGYMEGMGIQNIKLVAHWTLFFSDIFRLFRIWNLKWVAEFVVWKGMEARNVKLTVNLAGAFHLRHLRSNMSNGRWSGVTLLLHANVVPSTRISKTIRTQNVKLEALFNAFWLLFIHRVLASITDPFSCYTLVFFYLTYTVLHVKQHLDPSLLNSRMYRYV